jgi:hypothetical protein
MLPAVPPVGAIPFAHQIDMEHIERRHPQFDYSSRSGRITGNPQTNPLFRQPVRIRIWTAQHKCAIIAMWKPDAHSAAQP